MITYFTTKLSTEVLFGYKITKALGAPGWFKVMFHGINRFVIPDDTFS